MYHGFNREDEFYLKEKNLKKPEHKRVKKWPSIEEFWNSNEPKEFRLMCSDGADWKKFRRWLRNYLIKIDGNPDYDYDKEALAQYEAGLDICLGDFDKKEEVHTDMAVFKWSNQMYMTEAEIKALPEEKK